MSRNKEVPRVPAPASEDASLPACGGEVNRAAGLDRFFRASGTADDVKVGTTADREEALWSDAACQNPERVKDMRGLLDELRARLAAFDRQCLAIEKGETKEIKDIVLDSFPLVKWLVENPADAEAMGCRNVKVAPQAKPMIGDKVFEFVWSDIKSIAGRSTKSKVRTVILVAIALGTTMEKFEASFDNLERAYKRALPIRDKLTAEGDLPESEPCEPSLETLVCSLPKKNRALVDAALGAEPICAVPDGVPVEGEVELLIRLGGHIQGPLRAPLKDIVNLIGRYGIDLTGV